ncbi:MAG TPA: hypothetical protein VGK47_14910 [Nitrososphaeraceae archaeon]
MPKVPVQKGPISVLETSKNELYSKKQREAQSEADMRRDFRSPKLKMPKNGK